MLRCTIYVGTPFASGNTSFPRISPDHLSDTTSNRRAVSFHAVSFGPEGSSTWLRRMVQIAKEVQATAPRDPLLPANAIVESSYNVALDSVRHLNAFTPMSLY